MFAIMAVLAFAIALILNVVGGHSGKYVLDFAFAGGLLVAAHLVWGGWRPWERTGPRP
jgi:type VI protein secretion system component VasK